MNNNEFKIKRRQLLQLLGQAGLVAGFPKIGRAQGSTWENVYMISVDYRSNCGKSSGLTQPINATKWAKGTFVFGSDDDGGNPLTSKNRLVQDGNFVWNLIQTCLGRES